MYGLRLFLIMTREQKRSAIKRINQRLVQMAETFGDDSKAVEDYISDIKTLFPPEYVRPYQGKGGHNIVAISHSNAACDAISEERLQAMLAKPTARDIVKKEKKQIAEEKRKKEKDVTMKEVRTYEKERTYVEKWIDKNSDKDRYNAFSAAFKGDHGIPSYGDLKAAIELWEEARAGESKAANSAKKLLNVYMYIVYDDNRKESRSGQYATLEAAKDTINTRGVKYARVSEVGKKTGYYYNGQRWAK